MYQYILFDLDGTLVDSGLGVTNSAAYALRKWGKEVPDRASLNRFIGPPLAWSFQTYHGFTAEESRQAIQDYREYYRDKGIYEAEVYPGIEELLKDLKQQGLTLVVATSKPEEFAKRVLAYLKLDTYFDRICGATMDETRISKAEVIRYALEPYGKEAYSRAVMIGDREHDMIGAKETGVDSIGILFGYGSRKELEQAGAGRICETPEQVFKAIRPSIRALLWDVDGTLLNFKAAEKAAIRTLFKAFGFGECTDEQIERYSAINDRYWKMLERGEAKKPQILVDRFRDFFAAEGLDPSLAENFNTCYQMTLGDTIVFCDDGYNIVRELKGKIPQYGVTNGTLAAQTKKLQRSGLGELFDDVFISDRIGFEKPDARFFDPVMERLEKDIPGIQKEEVLIVGDSLTSDIKGGVNAGLRTCWYHPAQEAGAAAGDLEHRPRIDYEIRDLHEIFTILRGETL